LSIRDSEKLRIAGAAVLTVAGAYMLAVASLGALARHVESTQDVYPYKNEDWLRHLLPTLYADHGEPRLLITGPSTARENLVIEVFADSFPDHEVVQGGLSLGTLSDVLLSLDHLRLVYGPESLPEVLVLGISTRFIADIPAERPFEMGLARYSPHYRVERGGTAGPRLVQKSPLEGLVARLRFLIYKQAPRYQVALSVLARPLIPSALSEASSARDAPGPPLGSRIRRLIFGQDVSETGMDGLIADLISPYKYRTMAPWTREELVAWLDAPDTWWKDVHAWDPDEDRRAVVGRLERLLDVIRSNKIELYVVNLPEREVSRRRYDERSYSRYLELVRTALGDTPFLDLRDALPDDEFYDLEHATLEGSLRITNEAIAFLREASEQNRAPAGAELSARSSEPSAPEPDPTRP
jgi:hypothetical protein